MTHLQTVLAQLPTSSCVPWPGACYQPPRRPYGKAGLKGLPAHRYVWTALGRSIPEGLQLDHLCRNHRCVNPAHLEPVANNRISTDGSLDCRPCVAAAQRRASAKRRQG